MQSLKDLKGKTFGYITAISNPIVENNKTLYIAKCICGKELKINAWYLRHKSRSCGCKNGNPGHSPDSKKSGTYSTWDSMIQRCTNKKSKFFYCYGGRAITVCKRWFDFKNFLEDMGEKPEGMSLDRINSSGDYEPGNCRWATSAQQNRNRKSNINITHNGKTMCVKDWCDALGINVDRVYGFIRRGVSPEEALFR